jgi:hypothetical protein
MLVFDHLLSFPLRGLWRVFREIHRAAEQECENESEAIRTALRELYMRLEAHQITEDEFDVAERPLLDRLDQLEARGMSPDDEPGADE